MTPGDPPMRDYPSDVAFTPAVKAVQERKGSRRGYARMERGDGWETTVTPELAEFLAGLGRQAVGMLNKYASGCTIDPDEDALWLEQMLRPDTVDTEVDEAVGQFANALSFWTSTVRRAA